MYHTRSTRQTAFFALTVRQGLRIEPRSVQFQVQNSVKLHKFSLSLQFNTFPSEGQIGTTSLSTISVFNTVFYSVREVNAFMAIIINHHHATITSSKFLPSALIETRSSAAGPDDISAVVCKKLAYWLAEPLSTPYQQCMHQNAIPIPWRQAKVGLLYKG